MYIVTTANLAADGTSYYSSLSGWYAHQPLQVGIEHQSSLLRGYLLAVIQGIQRIESVFGTRNRHQVDILIPDEATAEQLRKKSSVSKFLHGDDDDLWRQLLQMKESYELRFISSHSESEHIVTIWKWTSVPPISVDPPPTPPDYVRI